MRNLKTKTYFVYILASKTGTLYIGVTNDLSKRIWEHKNKLVKGFTEKYNIDQLMYYYEFDDIEQAIAVEKKIKKWRREKKLDLIRELNLNFRDLLLDF